MRWAILIVIVFTAACSKKPNVLLVTFDTTRADRINARITPNVDALAKRGTSFATAIASQPLTAPSHATILTGAYPYRHGVRNNGAYTLAAKNVSLAERLRDAGYATHAIVASYVLDSRFGFDQGFATYDDDLSAGGAQREIDAKRVADKALRWLGVKREQPFFLWLHFYDPHAPYVARAAGEAYASEIQYADRELGRVLAALPEDTLVVFTADHGESLGEHGERGHGLFVYDATTRVPLVFAGPNVPARRLDWVASHTDIVPTILDLLGLDASKGAEGVSLAQWWDKSEVPDRHAYSETFAARMNFGWSELRSMRSRTTRVVDAPRREVIGEEHEARRLFAELARIRAADDFRAGVAPVDDETRRQLAALGYIMSNSSSPGAARIDPKDRVATWEAFHEAQALLRRRDFTAAADALRQLAASEPASDAIATLLATALAESGRTAEALDVLKQLIERNPRDAAPYLARASLLRTVGERNESRALAEAVLRFEPQSTEARVALADVAMDERQYARAEAILRDARRRNPKSSAVLAALGNCLNRAGKTAEALALLERAHRDDPNSHVLAYNYAVLLERTGRLREALLMYRAALRLDPEHAMTWNNIGSLLDRAGRRREAIICIARARRLDPRNAEATFNLGALLLETGRAREALPLLEQAVAQRPEFEAARTRLAAARAQVTNIN